MVSAPHGSGKEVILNRVTDIFFVLQSQQKEKDSNSLLFQETQKLKIKEK
jgi:hypothetical protein